MQCLRKRIPKNKWTKAVLKCQMFARQMPRWRARTSSFPTWQARSMCRMCARRKVNGPTKESWRSCPKARSTKKSSHVCSKMRSMESKKSFCNWPRTSMCTEPQLSSLLAHSKSRSAKSLTLLLRPGTWWTSPTTSTSLKSELTAVSLIYTRKMRP